MTINSYQNRIPTITVFYLLKNDTSSFPQVMLCDTGDSFHERPRDSDEISDYTPVEHDDVKRIHKLLCSGSEEGSTLQHVHCVEP